MSSRFLDLVYQEMRMVAAVPTYRVLDEPVLLFSRFEISDIAISLLCTIVFGVLWANWFLVLLSLTVTLGALPLLRKRFPAGTLQRMFSSYTAKLPLGPFSWGRMRA